jgi:glycosyltransferase involved in cell wall biosynthesis
MKERGQPLVARFVVARASAVVADSDAMAEAMRARRTAVKTLPNGCDFEDFGLEYRRGDRRRDTHTGAFFGHREPRPFLTALAAVEEDDVARFVGGLGSGDRDHLGLGDRLEVLDHVPLRAALEPQRESEALLLLLPEASGRGRTVPSDKSFAYLAAERPILVAVPPGWVAAEPVWRADAGIVVVPDDVRALRDAIVELRARWRAGALDGIGLMYEVRQRLPRRTLAELLRSVP